MQSPFLFFFFCCFAVSGLASVIVTEGGGREENMKNSIVRRYLLNTFCLSFIVLDTVGTTERVRQGCASLRHYNELDFKDLNI